MQIRSEVVDERADLGEVVIADLKSYDEELTIYVTEPWTCESEAVLALEPEQGGLPDEATSLGATYFIEVFVATDFLDGYIENLGPRSVADQCERLIFYARSDS